jgi:thioredoxin-like negative regulator of GroEL
LVRTLQDDRPVVEEIAVEKTGLLKVCKVDVDKNRGIAGNTAFAAFHPAVVQNGQVVEQIVGAAAKPNLLKKLEPHLS